MIGRTLAVSPLPLIFAGATTIVAAPEHFSGPVAGVAMTPILRSEQIRLVDQHAVAMHRVPSLVLMENAARGACDALLEAGVDFASTRILILCGRGNNGGDGIALARHCLIQGASVECVLVEDAERLSPDAAAQLAMLRSLAPDAIVDFGAIDRSAPPAADIVVDALLGTGATGEPRGAYAEAIEWVEGFDGVRIALDLPTGVDSDTGAVPGPAFVADLTVTMAALKPGLLLGDGAWHSGSISVVHIGVPESTYPEADCWLLDRDVAAALLPPIDQARHKYDRGKVLVLAGARGMTGAAVMTAEAAVRTGAGLTVLALPHAAHPLSQVLAPEVMTRLLPSGDDGAFAPDALDALLDELTAYRAIAVGPGLSKSSGAIELVAELLGRAGAPIVLDADGLNGYTGAVERLAERTAPLVITPHHGEMARLLGRSSDDVAADVLASAREAARRSDAVVVLKGAPTVVALPDGRAWINAAGNPGMASGGSGDVLTGVIASLVAQTGNVAQAALLGVYLHSCAADIAAATTTERALVATDITASVGAAYRAIEEAAE